MYLVNSYHWDEVGTETVVDIRGFHGLVSIAIARQFPSITIIVQDLHEVIFRDREIIDASKRLGLSCDFHGI